MLYGISFIFIIFLQVEDSRNKSQIEQGSEINNDSQSDQVRNLFHYFFLNFLRFHFPFVIGISTVHMKIIMMKAKNVIVIRDCNLVVPKK